MTKQTRIILFFILIILAGLVAQLMDKVERLEEKCERRRVAEFTLISQINDSNKSINQIMGWFKPLTENCKYSNEAVFHLDSIVKVLRQETAAERTRRLILEKRVLEAERSIRDLQKHLDMLPIDAQLLYE